MKPWADCYRDPMGTIYVDETITRAVDGAEHSVRWLVMRGAYSLTAYVGAAPDAPQAGWHHDLVPLDVHGGLAFSGLGDGAPQPAGWWWYGWDYGHAFDRTWMDQELRDCGVELPVRTAHPSDSDQAEQRERDQRMAEFIEDMRSGKARATMDAEAKKARRLRELEG